MFDAWAYQRRKEDVEMYDVLAESFSTTAPLYAAFCKIVNVSFGFYKGGEVYIKSFCSDDELTLLNDVSDFLNSKNVNENFSLAGFAVKGYDIPILCKRFLANGLPIPDMLDNSTKKPWELDVFDLLEILKMNGFSNESLITACLLLGVESPKNNLDGRLISDLFYSEPVAKKTKGKSKDEVVSLEEHREQSLIKIKEYCNKDVHSTLNCFLKILGWDLVSDYKVR